MEREDITIRSDCDKLPLSVTIIRPSENVKGIFQISHGMSEHKERYFDFMKFMAANGYVCVINDHRGHGKSVLSEKDFGFFYEEKGDYIVEDLHQITMYMKKLYPDIPAILFGHSMGSLVARKYIKKYDGDIDKLVLGGTPSRNGMAGIGLHLTKFVAKFKGDHYRSDFLNSMLFGGYGKKFKDSASVNVWLSRNQDNVAAYDKDELNGFVFTTNGFINLMWLMKDVYSKEGWRVSNKNLPIFFLAGSDDPVIISEKKWMESRKFLCDRGYANVSGKLYPGLRHELLNEIEKDMVYKDILDFTEA